MESQINFKFGTILCLLVFYGVCVAETEAKDEIGLRVKRADDVPALQVIVEQQAALLQSLQAKVTALESETAALKTRQQVISSAVAFSVRFKTDVPGTGIPMTTHSTLMFDNVIYNAGNGYDATTGLFTAPVSGSYAFFLALMSVYQHPAAYLSIVKQGTMLDEVFAEGGTDNYDQGSTQTAVHLVAGDKVWVRQESGNSVRGGTWTVFTGYLLHAD